LSKPVVVAEYVIIGDMDGNLHFLGKRFGQIKARIFIDSNGISITPVVDQKNNLLYLLTNSGRLIAVNYVTSSYNNR
jgi:outer membrane protein assembly factor BamB